MARPAVFLDRDGVLNEENGFVTSCDDLKIYEYSKRCVDEFRALGFIVIVITNQSGIARGLYTEEILREINEKVKKETAVDDIYYCPHYPDGSVPKYSRSCNCRKPKTGLIQRACREYDIDLSRSFMVGDRDSDIKTGQNAGIKTILVRTGYGLEDEKKEIEPDYVCDDLRDVVLLLKNMKRGVKV